MAASSHLLITGRPGIGKTTLIKWAVEMARRLSIPFTGFYTEEIREKGERTGFRVISLADGKADILALKGAESRFKVGKYGVFVDRFESIAIPAIKGSTLLVIVDEIGKMELHSERFKEIVRSLLRGSHPRLLATIQEKSLRLLDSWGVRNRVQLLRLEKKGDERAREAISRWIENLRHEKDQSL
ncbi:MAG TPA: hypothetical protein ENG67_02500 [candidate division WOR-3 bacterium]|uniref:AAA+ ATPase domain-containing protein n=1 Tax=candidate division WOR-3 bacterium TaxID=2052148 RepID=A0A7C1BFB2_UNCW3|nr:hypothetical protein [candidate division WOR-3 bacterium]